MKMGDQPKKTPLTNVKKLGFEETRVEASARKVKEAWDAQPHNIGAAVGFALEWARKAGVHKLHREQYLAFHKTIEDGFGSAGRGEWKDIDGDGAVQKVREAMQKFGLDPDLKEE